MERIGLIAGEGQLPVIFAQEARKKGVKVIGFGIKGMASPDLAGACDRIHWLGIDQIKKFFFLLLAERIKNIAMLGKVSKAVIYNSEKKDGYKLDLLKKSEDKKDYAILEKITAELEKRGIKVINSTDYLEPLLPEKGVLTKQIPSDRENDDIKFGFKIAKEIAGLDIGQTVVVKDKNVVSVEAMEGTDSTVKRSKDLSVEDFTVVKVSRPKQDMRWDVPVVGPDTVKLIAEYKGKILAIEAQRMFLVEKEKCLEIADNNGMSIVVM